ncbi:hypothetical protein PLESTF_000762500 [Pleodorina starrii]|nr:hypothetical protein PLESTM_001341400 [Pleodorina starrii]GLC68953.1 hypothetical protein PLESTF_000762500 [Pleodorina starrii]
MFHTARSLEVGWRQTYAPSTTAHRLHTPHTYTRLRYRPVEPAEDAAGGGVVQVPSPGGRGGGDMGRRMLVSDPCRRFRSFGHRNSPPGPMLEFPAGGGGGEGEEGGIGGSFLAVSELVLARHRPELDLNPMDQHHGRFSQPVSQPASKPASQQASQPASKPASQSASQPVSQPASQPVTQPASQSASQSVSQASG